MAKSIHLLALVLAAAGLGAGPLCPAAPAEDKVVTVDVPANQAWTPTGVRLEAGQRVQLAASGTVQMAGPEEKRAFYHDVPPEGREERHPGAPQPGMPALALLGKVGEKGTVFLVGKYVNCLYIDPPAFEAGELYLGVNDGIPSDNSGKWTVRVTILGAGAENADADLAGVWVDDGKDEIEMVKKGDAYEGVYRVVGDGLKPFGFTKDEVGFRNFKPVGGGKFAGEVKWRSTDPSDPNYPQWKKSEITLTGDSLKITEDSFPNWTRRRTETITLKSDETTLAATLGGDAPNQAVLDRLDKGDDKDLKFEPVRVDALGTMTKPPPNAPPGTDVVNIPGGGQSGFFKMTFTLPDGFANPRLSGSANVDDVGRVFLNGKPLTPSLAGKEEGRVTQFADATFTTSDASMFRAGENVLLIADANTGGEASGGAFFATVTYSPRGPGAGESAKPPTGLGELQGTWEGASGGGEGWTMVIEGDKARMFQGGSLVSTSTIKVDASKDPRAYDTFTTDDPPQGFSIGIYKIEGDTLTVCYVLASSGKSRPAEFAGGDKGGDYLQTYKRKKADASPGVKPGPGAARDLSGAWVYGGNKEGAAKITQDKDAVTMELTYTPGADANNPGPHYRIKTTLAGRELNGTWEYVGAFAGFAGQKGKFHAEVSEAGNTITVSMTDDPDGVHHWSEVVLTRSGDTKPGPGGPAAPGGVCADARTLAIMDEWLAKAVPPQKEGESLRYEPWGRVVGKSLTAEIKTAGPPDTKLTRCEFLWEQAADLKSMNDLGTLKEYVEKRLKEDK